MLGPADLPPIEKYKVLDDEVYVIRDDLCSAFPGPNNSKVRGLQKKLLTLREMGVKTVATQDTSISRAGWGVSWLCKQLDMTNINFYAQRKEMNFYQKMSQAFGGIMVPMWGTYSSGFRAMAKHYLILHNPEAHFLPVGLATEEAIIANSELFTQLPTDLKQGTMVISVSSGAICAGIAFGASIENAKTKIVGVLSSHFDNREKKIRDWMSMCNLITGKAISRVDLNLVDLGYKYKDIVNDAPPFACDIYMDRKAWQYIIRNLSVLPKPITFLNIGGEWSPEKGLNGLRGDGKVTQGDIDKYIGGLKNE